MKSFEISRRQVLRTAFGITIIALILLVNSGAEVLTRSISGELINESSGLGISGAKVTLLEHPEYNATTLSNGSYIIENVPDGLYNISASAFDYTANESTVNVNGPVVKEFSLSKGSLTGDYLYYSLKDPEIASNKVSTLSDVGTHFIIPQYGDFVWWDTEVYITDFSGLGANLTLKYYYPDGTPSVTETPNVPANGTIKWIPSDNKSGRPTVGRLDITSDRDVVGSYRIYTKFNDTGFNTGVMSNKFYTEKDADTNLIIPQYGDHSGWDTFIAISDASGLGANLTFRYFYPNGTLAVTETQIIPANGMYWELPISDGKNGRPTMGRLEITSDKPVAGEYRIYSLNSGGIMANKIYTSKDKGRKLFIPEYGDGTVLNTWVVISDASGIGANLTLKYYYPNGTFAMKETPSVPANGMYTFIPSDGYGLRPKTGRLVISSDNEIIGEMRKYNNSGRGIISNSLFTKHDADRIFIVPYFNNNLNNRTNLTLVDRSNFNTTIIVDYHSLNGTLTQSETRIIPSGGQISWAVSNFSEGNVFIHTLPKKDYSN